MTASSNDNSLSDGKPGAPSRDGPLATVFHYLLGGLNAVGTVWIFALMVLINRDVFGRYFFNAPVDGVPEMIELSIVGIVFLQLGDATRTGRLTRSDGLFYFVLRKWPAMGRVMGALFDLLGAFLMGLILYGSVPMLREAWAENHFIGEIGIFTAPTWPIKAIIVVGCLVTLLQFVVFAWRYAFGGWSTTTAD